MAQSHLKLPTVFTQTEPRAPQLWFPVTHSFISENNLTFNRRTFLFNDTLNTFYLRLYGIGHVVKGHSDGQRGKLLPPLHGLLFPISSKRAFICTIPQTGSHIPRPCYTSRGALGVTRNSSMGPP